MDPEAMASEEDPEVDFDETVMPHRMDNRQTGLNRRRMTMVSS